MSEKVFDLGAWLHGLGLSQYEEIFREEDLVTLELVVGLTNQELKEVGVNKLGHRKQLRAGIDALIGSMAPPAPPRMVSSSSHHSSPATSPSLLPPPPPPPGDPPSDDDSDIELSLPDNPNQVRMNTQFAVPREKTSDVSTVRSMPSVSSPAFQDLELKGSSQRSVGREQANSNSKTDVVGRRSSRLDVAASAESDVMGRRPARLDFTVATPKLHRDKSQVQHLLHEQRRQARRHHWLSPTGEGSPRPLETTSPKPTTKSPKLASPTSPFGEEAPKQKQDSRSPSRLSQAHKGSGSEQSITTGIPCLAVSPEPLSPQHAPSFAPSVPIRNPPPMRSPPPLPIAARRGNTSSVGDGRRYKKGYLSTNLPQFSGWQRRFFVLDHEEKMLRFWKLEKDYVVHVELPLDEWDLRSLKDVTLNKELNKFTIAYLSPKGEEEGKLAEVKVTLKAETGADFSDWTFHVSRLLSDGSVPTPDPPRGLSPACRKRTLRLSSPPLVGNSAEPSSALGEVVKPESTPIVKTKAPTLTLSRSKRSKSPTFTPITQAGTKHKHDTDDDLYSVASISKVSSSQVRDSSPREHGADSEGRKPLTLFPSLDDPRSPASPEYVTSPGGTRRSPFLGSLRRSIEKLKEDAKEINILGSPEARIERAYNAQIAARHWIPSFLSPGTSHSSTSDFGYKNEQQRTALVADKAQQKTASSEADILDMFSSRNLVATSPTLRFCTGYLHQKKLKRWVKRYFLLDLHAGMLQYFNHRKDAQMYQHCKEREAAVNMGDSCEAMEIGGVEKEASAATATHTGLDLNYSAALVKPHPSMQTSYRFSVIGLTHTEYGRRHQQPRLSEMKLRAPSIEAAHSWVESLSRCLLLCRDRLAVQLSRRRFGGADQAAQLGQSGRLHSQHDLSQKSVSHESLSHTVTIGIPLQLSGRDSGSPPPPPPPSLPDNPDTAQSSESEDSEEDMELPSLSSASLSSLPSSLLPPHSATSSSSRMPRALLPLSVPLPSSSLPSSSPSSLGRMSHACSSFVGLPGVSLWDGLKCVHCDWPHRQHIHANHVHAFGPHNPPIGHHVVARDYALPSCHIPSRESDDFSATSSASVLSALSALSTYSSYSDTSHASTSPYSSAAPSPAQVSRRSSPTHKQHRALPSSRQWQQVSVATVPH
eukprot:gb/GEZN01000581.1/.p1 GENE.gb/GEZN01000581.1/~~gb/GEZN01000581.1/.p1  ORF type:complete len:1155 (+),score=219.74 gb/GEZN01000581.1/:47-3511(+)